MRVCPTGAGGRGSPPGAVSGRLVAALDRDDGPTRVLVIAAVVVASSVATPLALACALAALGGAALVDARTERIPNRLLVLALLAALSGAAAGPTTLHHVALGTVLAAAPLVVVVLTRGVGMGDVKMAGAAGATGALLHPLIGLGAVFLAALGSGTYSRAKGVTRMALGPWLFGGVVIASVSAMASGWST